MPHARTQRRPTAPVPFGNAVGIDPTDGREAAADVKVARAINHRRAHEAIRALSASQADPIGISELSGSQREGGSHSQRHGTKQVGMKDIESRFHGCSMQLRRLAGKSAGCFEEMMPIFISPIGGQLVK